MSKHIHILGICGTFMGGIAALARELGYRVTGWDQHVYPPMSTQLEALGIEITDSLDPAQFLSTVDLVLIGNAMSRGHPLVEWVLNERIPYQSGPAWLGETILRSKRVIAVAGTHGKTTTASMLVNILHDAGLAPGFLVGGVVRPFEKTALLGESDIFIIEADEYDTAFFDKRSKFVHYHPFVFVINNLEFDHADIFPDLAAIQRQFAHALRLVPSSGHVVIPAQQPTIEAVLAQGVWSTVCRVGGSEAIRVDSMSEAGDRFVINTGQDKIDIAWNLLGHHNVSNAIMACAAAHCIGVKAEVLQRSLSVFSAPARRMERKAQHGGISLYDDFAHHPTAIATTLSGLRARVGEAQRIVAIFEPRSNTMKAGVHQSKLAPAFAAADAVYVLKPPGADWLEEEAERSQAPWQLFESLETLIAALTATELPNDHEVHWLVMSNGGFGGIHEKLAKFILAREEA